MHNSITLNPLGKVLFVLMLLLSESVFAERFTFAAIGGNPYQAALSLVMKEAFTKIGHQLDVVVLPGRRALALSNNGSIDGEVGRIFDTSRKYKNLIRVDIPIGSFEGVAISTRSEESFEGVEQIKSHSIAQINGSVWSNQILDGAPAITKARNYQQLIGLLMGGRVRYALGDKAIFDAFKLQHEGYYSLAPAIVKLNMYPHVHKSQSHLIEPLMRTLNEMKESGEISRIRENFLRSFANSMSRGSD